MPHFKGQQHDRIRRTCGHDKWMQVKERGTSTNSAELLGFVPATWA